jgi:hypothetical protein
MADPKPRGCSARFAAARGEPTPAGPCHAPGSFRRLRVSLGIVEPFAARVSAASSRVDSGSMGDRSWWRGLRARRRFAECLGIERHWGMGEWKHAEGILAAVMVIAGISLCSAAHAGTFDFDFTGPGGSGSIDLTYGAATDLTYSSAFVVTGISGTFTDSNIGILNAPIGMLEPRNFAMPEPGNHLAPNSFSRFAVAAGLPAVNNGFLTYDNLLWPGGSPPTATDYPIGGGFLDISLISVMAGS